MSILNNFENAVDHVRDIFRRSRPSIVGLDSMRHLVIYLTHRYLTKDKCAQFGIPEELSWEAMYDLGEKEVVGWEKSRSMIAEGEESLLNYLDGHFGTGDFNYNIRDWKIHREICQKFNDIDIDQIKSDIDLLGLLYEKHLKTGSGPARDLGQYFTDRQITRYMVELCNPKVINGEIESVVDPTMGTAGFLSSYIKYIDEHYEGVNWQEQQHLIHGYDVDQFVGAMAKINLFLETHGVEFENLVLRDSLYEDLLAPTFDVILANMPFGIKGLVHAKTCDKVKDLKIRGTKSEPLFLQLMMTSLNLGGRCAVVVPDGVLTNTNSRLAIDTRRYLLENFDLRKVVKMEGKFFMNTSIKPYILYFRNNGRPTSKINFYEIDRVEGEMIENKILSVPVENLDDKFVIDIRRFIVNQISIIPTQYRSEKIKDLVEMKKGTNIPERDRSPEGNIPYYTSNGIKGYVENSNFEGPAIVMAANGAIGGNSVHWVVEPFHAGNHALVIKTEDFKFLRFLYHYLKLSDIEWFKQDKTTIPQLDLGRFKEMDIAVPNETEMNIINEYFDNLYQGEIIQEDTMKLTKNIMTLALQDIEMKRVENIINCQRIILQCNSFISSFKQQMRAMFDFNANIERIRLGDILGVSAGEFIPKDEQVRGEYPIYGGGDTSGNINRYNQENKFIISKGGISKKCVRFVRDKFFMSQHAWTFLIKDESFNYNYVGYYLMTIQDRIYDLATGTAQKGINKDSFYSLRIPSIPLERQQLLASRLNGLYSQIENMERLIIETQENAKIILENYLQ